MKRQSWDDKQLDRLKAELEKKGNTKEAWLELCDFHDLPAIAAHELAFQVVPPITVVEGPVDLTTEDEGHLFGKPGELCTAPEMQSSGAFNVPPAAPVRVLSARKFTPLKKNA